MDTLEQRIAASLEDLRAYVPDGQGAMVIFPLSLIGPFPADFPEHVATIVSGEAMLVLRKALA